VVVRRTLSLVLAVIVAVCSAAASSPHVHAYGGHEHSDHQHGPASHGHEHHHGAPVAPAHDHHDAHDARDAHDDDRDVASARIEACDAGDHAIRIPGAAGPTPRAYEQPAVVVSALIVAPPAMPARLAIAPLDVRVHGPPPDTRLPARAPPLTSLA
jgi:hypothetical protein